jgi:hypothetical protein
MRRGTFTSVKDLISAIETFIDGWNVRCEPFVWTNPPTTSSRRQPKVTRLQQRDTSEQLVIAPRVDRLVARDAT